MWCPTTTQPCCLALLPPGRAGTEGEVVARLEGGGGAAGALWDWPTRSAMQYRALGEAVVREGGERGEEPGGYGPGEPRAEGLGGTVPELKRQGKEGGMSLEQKREGGEGGELDPDQKQQRGESGPGPEAGRREAGLRSKAVVGVKWAPDPNWWGGGGRSRPRPILGGGRGAGPRPKAVQRGAGPNQKWQRGRSRPGSEAAVGSGPRPELRAEREAGPGQEAAWQRVGLDPK